MDYGYKSMIAHYMMLLEVEQARLERKLCLPNVDAATRRVIHADLRRVNSAVIALERKDDE